MKKFTSISIFVFAFLMIATTNMQAQKFSNLDKSPLDIASYPSDYKDANKLLKVIYSRPQLKRQIFKQISSQW